MEAVVAFRRFCQSIMESRKFPAAAAEPRSADSRLVPVEVLKRRAKPQPAAPGIGVAVLLAGGRRIEVPPAFDPQTLHRVIQVLETL